MDKQSILNEIQRTASENGGKPLGAARFANETGINRYQWGKYWARFGDAQKEAGLVPNKLNLGYGDDYLLKKYIQLTREIGKIPTSADIRLKGHNDTTFPSHSTFDYLGTKNIVVGKLLEYSKKHKGYEDIIVLCEMAYQPDVLATEPEGRELTKHGFVYLVKGHPGEYKIGRTNLVDRRLSELGVTASIEQELIHEIKTDDPAGIEAYWHKRFGDKRMRGEWFKLSANDVKAFKRWKRIY